MAERDFALLLDDAIRTLGTRVSNTAIGDACGVGESKVREWRDPDGGASMAAWRLLLLPESVLRGVVERVLARRAGARPGSPTTAAARAIGSMGKALADLGVAMVDGRIDGDEADAIRGLLDAVIRDAHVLLDKLGPGGSR